MKQLPTKTVEKAIDMLQQGLSYEYIAAKLSTSKSTICRIKKRHAPAAPSARSGRPKLLDGRHVRQITREVTSGVVEAAVDIAKRLRENEGVCVSAETVRRCLEKCGFRSAHKVKKPFLSAKHMKARFEFAKSHKDWTDTDWKSVIWSDETKILRLGSDGRKWCWRQPHRDLNAAHVCPTVKHGGGSIMVWGCMTAFGPGFLAKIDSGLNADLYCQILDGELQQSMDWYLLDWKNFIFQHDNDPKHTAKVTKELLTTRNIRVLEWPAQSPDLNPIEHLWDLLKRKLGEYKIPPSGILELWTRVEIEWEKIAQAECVRLIESMPNRINLVLKAKGGYTKY